MLDLYLNVVDGLGGLRKSNYQTSDVRTSVYGNRKYHDGCRKSRRKPSGTAREDSYSFRWKQDSNVKERGLENNLLELIAADDEFPMTLEELQKTMDPSKYVGRAPSQVVEFMNDVIQPILDENKELLGVKAEINV